MNADHRAEAERHASQAAHVKSDRQHHPVDPIASDFHLRMAMVHATLARNEEDAASHADMRDANTLLRQQINAARRIITWHVADALAGSDLSAWTTARDLARDLDGAGLNIDYDVDDRLTERGIDSKWAWKHPTMRLGRDGKTWIDLGGHQHDLTKAYTDKEGHRWTWTGKVDDHDGYPIFTSDHGAADCDLGTLAVFGATVEGGA